MDEKKMLDLLRKQAEEIDPPESLSPDAIEQMLAKQKKEIKEAEPKEKEKEKEGQDMADQKKDTGKHRKKFPYRMIAELGSMAAIFVLGVTVYSQSKQITQLKKPAMTVQQLETETEKAEMGEAKTEAEQTAEKAVKAETEQTAEEAVKAETEQTAEEAVKAETEQIAEKTVKAETEQTTEKAVKAEKGPEPETEPATEAFENATFLQESSNLEDTLTYASGYQEIYDRLYELFQSNTILYDYDTSDGGLDPRSVTYMVEESASDVSTAATGDYVDYSRTNIQEAGVDEGDIIKTDGTWIYILKQDGSFSIVRANDGAPKVESTTKLEKTGLSNREIREMYLDGDRLIIVEEGICTALEKDNELYRTSTGYQTVLSVWDIADRTQPEQIGMLRQDGYYKDSRKNGDFVYLFTSYMPYIAETYEESTIVPRINGDEVAYNQFYLPEKPASENYLIISSVDITKAEGVKDQKVRVAGADRFYVSTENIYVTNENYNSGRDTVVTEIAKFHYKDGRITGVAAGSVKGYLNDSFSLNEYDGTLRVVSTYYDETWEEWNALYILDEKLQQLSAIEDLAQGETIRSARFFGTTGYFVTFRQTDPLFSVDLSDPEDPKVLGELKISGFSSYLHFYGENLLLGIGYEADENTGSTTGLKLSMFDISDPTNVKEVSRAVLPGMTWCPAIEDYKSILVDPDKNLIGFYCDKRYFVYSYDETGGFTRELLCDFYGDEFLGVSDQAGQEQGTSEIAATVDYDNMRGLYIGDYLYLAGNDFVAAYDMKDGFSMEKVMKVN